MDWALRGPRAAVPSQHRRLPSGAPARHQAPSPHLPQFTRETGIFDLLNVRLVHGWLTDPQASKEGGRGRLGVGALESDAAAVGAPTRTVAASALGCQGAHVFGSVRGACRARRPSGLHAAAAAAPNPASPAPPRQDVPTSTAIGNASYNELIMRVICLLEGSAAGGRGVGGAGHARTPGSGVGFGKQASLPLAIPGAAGGVVDASMLAHALAEAGAPGSQPSLPYDSVSSAISQMLADLVKVQAAWAPARPQPQARPLPPPDLIRAPPPTPCRTASRPPPRAQRRPLHTRPCLRRTHLRGRGARRPAWARPVPER